jgi:photosystem II stability/assembly factor-like uncharacterized protein
MPEYHVSVSRPWRACSRFLITALAIVSGTDVRVPALQLAVDISMFRVMTWRPLGPFRGGRTTVVTGIPSQPNTFLAGTANGGVWKTTDAGRTWRPLFDREATGAIGSIAVATSNPSVIYVGTGEAPLDRRAGRGEGLYRSSDGGQSWVHVGLTDHRHLSAISVDPTNPDRLFAASTGSAFGPSRDRGVFRSTNGGRSFEQVYFKDQDTGGLDLILDPSDPSIVYATLLQTRHPAWPADPMAGPGTGIIKSTDGGSTWRSADTGLPTFRDDGLRRIRLAISSSNRSRLFAVVAANTRGGVYRSDDAGASWTLAHSAAATARMSDDSTTVVVDPSNADVVYLTGPTVVRSTDGGRTFNAWLTDPAGGRYRAAWISPAQSGIVALGGDRGAVISVNSGDTWSSIYNQPTGQFAKVVTDSAFPYRVCGAERDSPPGCLPSRGAGGRIALGDWRSVSSVAGRAVAPDPQDPDVVYSGAVSRFDRRTGQAQDVRPVPPGGELFGGPLVFSADNRTLYYGANVLWRGVGGVTWSVISPELSRNDGDVRASISAVAPSSIDNRLVWAGTEDGSIQMTRDAGVSWSRSSPSTVAQWRRVSSIEPSHFDTSTAYASFVATPLDDDRPYIFRTRDAGATWQPITVGLPDRATVHAVREDAFRRGLLFASTERSVFVSFDDGERWQSLRLNLPPVPVTDLTVKDADLVVSTDGRGFWILDDISPLRQITSDLSRASAFLFRPASAWRTHPMQPVEAAAHRDEPSASNPPDGVAISYLVGPGAGNGPVTIEIIETVTGDLIRQYTDEASAGFHRVIWDLKYTPIAGRSIWVLPGTYQVRMTAGSQIARQAVVVRMDPRVRTSMTDLTAQFKISRAVYERRRRLAAALERLQNTPADRERAASLGRAAAEIERALDLLQQADSRPIAVVDAAAAAAMASADAALGPQ